MKVLNALLVLTLLLSAANSSAATPPPSKQGVLRQLVQQHLPFSSLTEAFGRFLLRTTPGRFLLRTTPGRFLLRTTPGRFLAPHWREALSSTLAAGILLFSSPAVAQDLRPIGRYTQATRAEHLSVFNLVLDFAETKRASNFVYIGKDRQDRALFLGLRVNVTILPVMEAELMIGVADAWLFDHEGLVQRDAEIEEVQAFLRPDANLARLHDITLLAVEGLDTRDYSAVRVAAFPPLETPLEIVVYRTDLIGERQDWVEVFSDAPLAREECMAISFDPERWSAGGNCATGTLAVSITAPVFIAKEGELVAFAISDAEMVVIPPLVQAYLEEALGVEAKQKLPLAWGAIKRGAY